MSVRTTSSSQVHSDVQTISECRDEESSFWSEPVATENSRCGISSETLETSEELADALTRCESDTEVNFLANHAVTANSFYSNHFPFMRSHSQRKSETCQLRKWRYSNFLWTSNASKSYSHFHRRMSQKWSFTFVLRKVTSSSRITENLQVNEEIFRYSYPLIPYTVCYEIRLLVILHGQSINILNKSKVPEISSVH